MYNLRFSRTFHIYYIRAFCRYGGHWLLGIERHLDMAYAQHVDWRSPASRECRIIHRRQFAGSCLSSDRLSSLWLHFIEAQHWSWELLKGPRARLTSSSGEFKSCCPDSRISDRDSKNGDRLRSSTSFFGVDWCLGSSSWGTEEAFQSE